MNNIKDRVTIYQVAKAANVSLATVSRVINNQNSVTEETRKRVEETIKKLAYKPSGLAQALAKSKSTTIGVIIPSANYVYIASLLNGINDVAKAKGFTISLFTTSASRKEALEMIEQVIRSHVDGVIVFDDLLDQDDINKITSYNVPTVAINNAVEGDKAASILFHQGAFLKTLIKDYYDQGGDKPMTFVEIDEFGRLLSRCENGFIEEHKELGKPMSIVTCKDSYTKTYDYFMEYFKTNKKGYFIAYRDSLAAGIMNAATDNNLKIPQDVEVLSLVGTKYAKIVRPTLSALHINMKEVGVKSVEMLIDLFNDKEDNKVAEFNAVYVKKDSTLF